MAVGQVASSVDWSTLGTNVGVFFAAASALFVGIRQGLKKISKGEIAPSQEKKQIAGATLIETTSLLMWSESNRDVVEALNRTVSSLEAMMDRIDTIEELKKEAVELRHQIERLRDKL